MIHLAGEGAEGTRLFIQVLGHLLWEGEITHLANQSQMIFQHENTNKHKNQQRMCENTGSLTSFRE